MITRRMMIGMLAGAVLDPDRLLWVPGKKLISIPDPIKRSGVWRLSEVRDGCWKLSGPGGQIATLRLYRRVLLETAVPMVGWVSGGFPVPAWQKSVMITRKG